MNRREFLGEALALPVAGLAVVAAACGGDDGGVPIDGPPPSCLQNGTQVMIAGNHGHSMTVAIVDIQAGAAKTYTLTGGDHSHTCTLSSGQFGQLASNQAVATRSSVDNGHSHPISITCV